MNEFLDYIQSLNPNYELEGIKKAYELAAEMHEGQLRKSGEPYLIHPVEVAKILQVSVWMSRRLSPVYFTMWWRIRNTPKNS